MVIFAENTQLTPAPQSWDNTQKANAEQPNCAPLTRPP